MSRWSRWQLCVMQRRRLCGSWEKQMCSLRPPGLEVVVELRGGRVVTCAGAAAVARGSWRSSEEGRVQDGGWEERLGWDLEEAAVG